MERRELDLTDYSRQQEMDTELDTTAIKENSTEMIIGCGGVGYWLAIMMALNGHKNFVLIDGDKVDATNLNRLPVPQSWIGRNKAVALRKLIRYIRPDCRITVVSTHITEGTLGLIEQWLEKSVMSDYQMHLTVWDTTDDARIQNKINEFVKKLGNNHDSDELRYRKIGYEGWDIGNYEEYAVWYPDDYQPGYRTARANAITSAISAGIGYFSRSLTNKDVKVNLKDLIKRGGYVNALTKPKQ